jgi:hypothetical protein
VSEPDFASAVLRHVPANAAEDPRGFALALFKVIRESHALLELQRELAELRDALPPHLPAEASAELDRIAAMRPVFPSSAFGDRGPRSKRGRKREDVARTFIWFISQFKFLDGFDDALIVEVVYGDVTQESLLLAAHARVRRFRADVLKEERNQAHAV